MYTSHNDISLCKSNAPHQTSLFTIIFMSQKDWFKIKRYPHIGLPLKPKDRYIWIENYVANPNTVSKHSFLPFIHKTSSVRKFRKEYNEKDGTVIRKDGKAKRKAGHKVRKLYYASHLDSMIYSYYAMEISDKYEKIIQSKEYYLHEVVNAYRSIKVNPQSKDSQCKCNIDFANDVFNLIRQYDCNEFNVLTYDVSNFFDTINHKKLLKSWCTILNESRLPRDHFNVYKNITRYSYVHINDIFNEFKSQIYTGVYNQEGEYSNVKRKKVSKIKYLRNQNAIAFCDTKQFLSVKRKLLRSTKYFKNEIGDKKIRNFGIPQGSPISSILANIYLLEFDCNLNKFVSSIGGFYRRYSDDIVIVCPTKESESINVFLEQEIQICELEINSSKTQKFQFVRDKEFLQCGQVYGDSINWNKNLTYLGFEFNGKTTLLKSGSLSRFYRKMKKYIRRSKNYAIWYNGELFKRRILKKFSYKGAKRIRRYVYDSKKKKFVKSDFYNYGNFLTYAYKASKKMTNNSIKQQVKRHWTIINYLIHNKTNKTT